MRGPDCWWDGPPLPPRLWRRQLWGGNQGRTTMSDIRTVGHGLPQPAALQLKLPEPSHLVKSEPAELGSRQRWSVASATPTARMAPATGQPCDALASPWAAACPRSPQDGVASSARLLLTSSADTTHGTRHMAPDTWRQVQEAVQRSRLHPTGEAAEARRSVLRGQTRTTALVAVKGLPTPGRHPITAGSSGDISENTDANDRAV